MIRPDHLGLLTGRIRTFFVPKWLCNYLLLMGLLIPTVLPGQQAYNVRLKASAEGMQAMLDSYVQPGQTSLSVNKQQQNGLGTGSRQPVLPALNGLTVAIPLADQSQLAKLAASGKSRKAATALSNTYTLIFQDSALNGASEEDPRLTALMATGKFEWVEPNRQRKLHRALATTPNDPDVEQQWYHPYIQTFAAWDTTRGDSNVVIGILDTGLDYGHPEFEGQLAINPLEDLNGNNRFDPWPDTVTINGVSGDFNNLDEDGNGYADDVIGYDFTDQPRSPFGGDYLFPDPDPEDDNDHGTLVAGILAARADNNYGGAGVAPGCRLKVLRCFAANGSGEDDDIARAIVYAADNGVKILNFSFGDIYPSRIMQEAIRYAYSKDVVMVASAGNGTGDEVHYPSNFDEVIAVSASALSFDQSSEILWPLSSFGLTVSLAAPGSGIYTTVVRDTSGDPPFDSFSGTSTAAPMVAGAAALIFSQRGACSPQQIRGLLTTSADDISRDGWDHFTGAGRLNILRALQTAAAPNVQILNPVNDGGAAADSIWVTGTIFEPRLRSWALEYQAGTAGSDNWTSITSGGATQLYQDTLGLWALQGLPEGEYTLRLRVDKSDGSTMEDRVRFLIDRTAPVIDLKLAQAAWDNDERKLLFVYRSSDQGRTTLFFRSQGDSLWKTVTSDRNTRNGEILLGTEQLSAGLIEFYLESTNAAGLAGITNTQTILFSPERVRPTGFDTLTYSLPMGHYLQETYDFDGDGLREVVMSEYDDRLNFGRLKIWEYNGSQFSAADSIAFKPILIPKDVADTDGDQLLEVLCSVNDSLYLIEQPSPGAWPATELYSNLGQTRFAARFANTDTDTAQELILKDFRDYYIYEGAGGSWTQSAVLPDVSGNYFGSLAPSALSGDFDGDGIQELIYGDADGDHLIFEQSPPDYNLVYLDTTDLAQAGSYLAQGDFDGDGNLEYFVASHQQTLREEGDFEYLPLYWHLRIFEAAGNNQYQMVWEDFLYDLDLDRYNAVTAGNIDTDPEVELIFSTFPRTYIFDYNGSTWTPKWFHYGALCTHHLVGDFNGNGVNEFALGRGDVAPFWEFDVNYQGPEAVWTLDGRVLGSTGTSLEWEAAPGAAAYRIWRGEIQGSGSVFISLIDSTSANSYVDQGLTPGQDYLYILESQNNSLSPALSPFSNAVVLRPHARFQVDSLAPLDPNSLRISFSEPLGPWEQGATPWFTLNGTQVPVLARALSDQAVLLSFDAPFQTGTNLLEIDTLLEDRFRGRLDPASALQTFVYQPDTSQQSFLTRWWIENSRQAVLEFNVPMDDRVLEAANYQVLPFGQVMAAQFDDAARVQVRLDFENVALGALGYPVTVIVTGVAGQNGAPIREKDGNAATFVAFQEDLSQAYVYPNPVQPNDIYEGLRFANLTRNAAITVYSVAGRKVVELEESDGDGGLTWDLNDLTGNKIKPGIYLFRIESEDGQEMIGKFSVLEY